MNNKIRLVVAQFEKLGYSLIGCSGGLFEIVLDYELKEGLNTIISS